MSMTVSFHWLIRSFEGTRGLADAMHQACPPRRRAVRLRLPVRWVDIVMGQRSGKGPAQFGSSPIPSKPAAHARARLARVAPFQRFNTDAAVYPSGAPGSNSRHRVGDRHGGGCARALETRQIRAALRVEIRNRTQNNPDARLPNTMANDGSATPPGCQIKAAMSLRDGKVDC